MHLSSTYKLLSNLALNPIVRLIEQYEANDRGGDQGGLREACQLYRKKYNIHGE